MNLESHLLVQHYFILFETDTSRRKFLFFVPRLSQDEEAFYSSFSSNFLYRFDCVLTIVPRFLPSLLKIARYFRSRLGVIMVHMMRRACQFQITLRLSIQCLFSSNALPIELQINFGQAVPC